MPNHVIEEPSEFSVPYVRDAEECDERQYDQAKDYDSKTVWPAPVAQHNVEHDGNDAGAHMGREP